MCLFSHGFSVQGLLKILKASLLVLSLLEDAVLSQDFFLLFDLHQLDGDSLLLLRLTHQSLHHLLISYLLLKGTGQDLC